MAAAFSNTTVLYPPVFGHHIPMHIAVALLRLHSSITTFLKKLISAVWQKRALILLFLAGNKVVIKEKK